MGRVEEAREAAAGFDFGRGEAGGFEPNGAFAAPEVCLEEGDEGEEGAGGGEEAAVGGGEQ